MGLFDKKFCDVCGEKIGLLGNRKLEDGNLCKDCAKKLSPWFSERRHSTLDEIKGQLDYRENNKAAVSAFHATQTYGQGNKKVHIDTRAGKFTIAASNELSSGNPDIIDCSCVRSVTTDKQEHKTEIKQKNAQGQMVSYTPPRYEYSYDFYCTVFVDHPYIDDMKFQLNDKRIEARTSLNNLNHRGNAGFGNMISNIAGQVGNIMVDQSELNYYYEMGTSIQNALMNSAAPAAGNASASSVPYAQPAQAAPATWDCPYCGKAANTGKFCENCGAPRS